MRKDTNMAVFVFIGCHILVFQATSRALSFVHQSRALRIQNQSNEQYNWESSWHSETTDGVTTTTSATFGGIAPGQGISYGTPSVWSYSYSYSGGTTSDEVEIYSSSPSDDLEDVTNNVAVGRPPAINDAGDPAPISFDDKYAPPSSQPHPPSSLPRPEESLDTPGTSGLAYPSNSSHRSYRAPSEPRNPLASVGNATKFATTQSTGDVQTWLEGHNFYRSQYGSPPMSWDSELANQARGVANTCRWKHTPHNPSGENIAAGQESAAEVIDAWVIGREERAIYDPNNPVMSHFTQVVWCDSTRIGCASATCDTIDGAALPQSPVVFWVCEYSPKGNIFGSFGKNVLAGEGGVPLDSRSSYFTGSDSPQTAPFQSKGSLGGQPSRDAKTGPKMGGVPPGGSLLPEDAMGGDSVRIDAPMASDSPPMKNPSSRDDPIPIPMSSPTMNKTSSDFPPSGDRPVRVDTPMALDSPPGINSTSGNDVTLTPLSSPIMNNTSSDTPSSSNGPSLSSSKASGRNSYSASSPGNGVTSGTTQKPVIGATLGNSSSS